MKNKLKRRISGVLAFLICFTTLFSMGVTPVHAATQTSEGYMVSYPRDGDSCADRGTSTWRHTPKSLMNEWNVNAMEVFTVHAQDSYTGKVCYCIEPGVSRHVGDSYSGFGEDFWDNYPSKYNDTINPSTIKVLLGRIMQYGYQGDISLNWKSQNASDRDKLGHIMATQVLIWETVVGERDSSFNHVSTGGKDTVKSMIGKGNPCYDEFIEYYNSIVSSVKSHTVIPSFMANSRSKADEFELEWNGSEYALTLTDKNDVLSKYSFSSNVTGMTFSKSGNKLTITTKEAPKDSVKITATKSQQRKGVLVWSDTKYGPDGGIQDVVTYSASVSDPVKAYVNVKVSYGSAKIVKASEDGKVETGKTIPYAGAGFQIYRPDGTKVEMTFTYPSVTTIDTFYTNEEGMLITPETLEYGKGYSLVEVQAPYGYVLKHDAVSFDVTEDNSSEESAVKVVAVELANYAQKGVIKEGSCFYEYFCHDGGNDGRTSGNGSRGIWSTFVCADK